MLSPDLFCLSPFPFSLSLPKTAQFQKFLAFLSGLETRQSHPAQIQVIRTILLLLGTPPSPSTDRIPVGSGAPLCHPLTLRDPRLPHWVLTGTGPGGALLPPAPVSGQPAAGCPRYRCAGGMLALAVQPKARHQPG